MSIEQKIAEILAESNKDETQIEAEAFAENAEDDVEIVAEGEMPPALKKAIAKKNGDDEDEEDDEEDEEKLDEAVDGGGKNAHFKHDPISTNKDDYEGYKSPIGKEVKAAKEFNRHSEEIVGYKKKAQEALKKGDKHGYHSHMANHHDQAVNFHYDSEEHPQRHIHPANEEDHGTDIAHSEARDYHETQAEKYKKKGMKEQYEEYSTFDIAEDVSALVNGEDLSEEFKTKAATIFEAAIVTRVKSEVARLEEEFAAELEEAIADNKEGLVEKVDGYLNYVVEQWINNNEIALENGMKSEILEGFVSGLKGLFEEHYIDIPEEKFDVLGSLEQDKADLEEKLNEQLAANVELNKVINESTRKEILSVTASNMTETEKEKFFGLAEELSFEDAETFEKKVQTIRENYFTGKTSTTNVNSVVTDEPIETIKEEVKLNGSMSQYVNTLNYLK